MTALDTRLSSKRDAELIALARERLPQPVQLRYNALTAKCRAEHLLADEQAELLALIEQIELADAVRLQALVELARRRACSVAAVMQDLGLQAPSHV